MNTYRNALCIALRDRIQCIRLRSSRGSRGSDDQRSPNIGRRCSVAGQETRAGAPPDSGPRRPVERPILGRRIPTEREEAATLGGKRQRQDGNVVC